MASRTCSGTLTTTTLQHRQCRCFFTRTPATFLKKKQKTSIAPCCVHRGFAVASYFACIFLVMLTLFPCLLCPDNSFIFIFYFAFCFDQLQVQSGGRYAGVVLQCPSRSIAAPVDWRSPRRYGRKLSSNDNKLVPERQKQIQTQ